MLQSIAHRDAEQWTRRLDHVRLILPDIGKDRTAFLAPRTYVARGDTARFSLAAQWNLHPAWKTENGRLAFGDDPIRTFLARFDSIDVLSPVAVELEMSDLKPIVLSENPALTSVSAEVAADLPGHPVPIAGEGRTLVLYFEVYHLRPDATGEAHFEVAYEVSRPGRPETATRSSSRYRTSHSTAKEAVTIDLARWRGEGEVEISLSVTEGSTGRSRSRSVRVTVEK